MQLTSKDLLKSGMAKNTIVYDDQCEHEFTRRLVAQLKCVARQKKLKPIGLLVPPGTMLSIEEWISEENGEYGKELSVIGGKIFGLEVQALEDIFTRLYQYEGGDFPKGKSQVVALLCDDGEVLLGCF